MTGFQSKRLMSNSRYADPVTIDHIIELRKEIAKLEMQLENTLAWVKKNVNQDLKDENKRLRKESRLYWDAFQKAADEIERLREAAKDRPKDRPNEEEDCG